MPSLSSPVAGTEIIDMPFSSLLLHVSLYSFNFERKHDRAKEEPFFIKFQAEFEGLVHLELEIHFF